MDETPDTSTPKGGSTPTTPAPISSDPVVAALLERLSDGTATPQEQAMIEHQVQVVSVTAGELRTAAAANPKHSLASHFAGAVREYPDTQQVYVEQPDLQALLQNRKVNIHHNKVGTKIIRTKSLS